MHKENIELKLKEFFHQYKLIKYSNNEIILNPTDKINFIYFIEKGLVKQYVIDEEGLQINLHIFTANSFFPMMILLSNVPSHYYFEAVEEVHVYKVPSDVVLEWVKHNPDISFDLASRLSSGLCNLLIKTEKILYKDAYSRIISILLFLAEKFGKVEDGVTTVTLPLTHAEIASWVGMQRETASRQIEILHSKGILKNSDKKFSIDIEKLKKEKKKS